MFEVDSWGGLFLGPVFSVREDFLITVRPVWQFPKGSCEDGEMIQNRGLGETAEGEEAGEEEWGPAQLLKY